MMSKELVNKKVVRAIALGLSAVMLTTPMTAMAAEGDDPVDGQEPKEVDVKEDSKYEAAEDAVETAQDSTKDGGTIVLDESATLPSGTVVTTVPDADDAAGADELKDVTAKVDGDSVDYTDVAADETAANSELVDAEAGLIQADASEAAAAVDVAEANKIVDEIEENNAEIEAAGQTVSAAADKAAAAADEAAKAATEAAVQAAADKAAQAVADAEVAQAEAQAAYDENVAKLTDAEAELAEAKANFDAAKASLTASKEDVAAAEEAVAAAEAKATALKAEVDKEAEELNNSKEAALKAAYDNMMAQKSVNNLYEDYGKDEDVDGIGDEWLDRFGDEGAGSGYWSAADAYFELYLKYVYGDNYVSGSWTKNKNTLDNGLAYDAERDNVFTVTYKNEDGDEVTALYNYHTADKDGNITIYEKQIATGETTVITQEEVLDYETKLGTETADGWVEYKAADGEIAVDKDDAKYVATGEAVVNNITLANNQTIDESSKKVGEPTLSNGQIVIETKANVETYKESKQTETQYIIFKDIDWEELELINRHELARQAAAAKIAELEKNPNYRNCTAVIEEPSISNGFCVGWAVSYDVVEVEEKVISTTSYSTTKYENHEFVVGSHLEPKETPESYEYWTERKNTTNDAAVKAAIDGITEKLKAVKEKQDAAAIALIASQEAKKDVETAKAELEKLSVDDAAYQAALAKYNDAKVDFEAAKATLDEINKDVEEAQQDYEDAAAELDRFADDGGDDSGDDDDAAPTVVPVPAPTTLADVPAAPAAAVAAPGAAAPTVVDIEDDDTPLAGAINEGNGNGDAAGGAGEVIVAGADEEIKDAMVTIEDEETPLAAGVDGDAKMSWWWLLIIALLGATGYKMYKDHQKKKEEAQEA